MDRLLSNGEVWERATCVSSHASVA